MGDCFLIPVLLDFFTIDGPYKRRRLAPHAKTQAQMDQLYVRQADICLAFRAKLAGKFIVGLMFGSSIAALPRRLYLLLARLVDRPPQPAARHGAAAHVRELLMATALSASWPSASWRRWWPVDAGPPEDEEHPPPPSRRWLGRSPPCRRCAAAHTARPRARGRHGARVPVCTVGAVLLGVGVGAFVLRGLARDGGMDVDRLAQSASVRRARRLLQGAVLQQPDRSRRVTGVANAKGLEEYVPPLTTELLKALSISRDEKAKRHARRVSLECASSMAAPAVKSAVKLLRLHQSCTTTMPWRAPAFAHDTIGAAAAEEDDGPRTAATSTAVSSAAADGRARRRAPRSPRWRARCRILSSAPRAPARSLARVRDGTETVSCLSDPTRSSLVSLGV